MTCLTDNRKKSESVRKCSILMVAAVSILFISPLDIVASQEFKDSPMDFSSSRSVEGILDQTYSHDNDDILSSFKASKKELNAKTGLSYGFDDYIQYFNTDSHKSPSDAASNVLRLYGTWTATGRGTVNDGALVFKIEYRSAIGSHISTQALGPSLGYAGIFASTYSDAGLILTNLYWRQRFAQGKGSFVIGQVDVYDYVNVNDLSSPWTAFSNLAFEQQGTFAGPSQGLGAAIRWRFNDQWTILGGIADANADPSEPANSAKKLFEKGETFQHIALGWSPKWDDVMNQLWQLTFWHVDEREEAGVEGGHGISLAISTKMDEWRSFLRAGYSNNGGTILERAVSVGVGYNARGGKDLAGIGIAWGRAAENSRDQYTTEAFYRYDITDFMQLTPSIQYIINPVNDKQTDNIFVAGVRLRAYF